MRMLLAVDIWLLTPIPLTQCPFAKQTASVWPLCMVEIYISHYQWLHLYLKTKGLKKLREKIFLVDDLNKEEC